MLYCQCVPEEAIYDMFCEPDDVVPPIPEIPIVGPVILDVLASALVEFESNDDSTIISGYAQFE